MSKIKNLRNKIKSNIESVKKINDLTKDRAGEAKKKANDNFDNFLKDLPTTDKLFGKKLSDYANNKKNNKQQNNRIFEDLLDIVGGIVGTNNVVESSDALSNKQKLKNITLKSVDHTLKQSQSIISNNVKKSLFAGDGICGGNTLMPVNTVTLKPSEFDFMNVLTVDPGSNSGKIVYEGNNNTGLVKMNKLLYDTFSSGQEFELKNDDTPLFEVSWNESTQEYTFDKLRGSTNDLEEWITSYYSNLEFIDISGVTKNAILMTLKGDGNEPPLFDKGWNDLNRLLAKLCAYCGNPNSNLNPSTATQFNENDEDIDSYFDFESTEGIDVDEETARYNKVLKFKDCNNYEVKINPQHFEDFVYMSQKKNINDAVNDALLHSAGEAYEKSGQSQPLDNFHLSIMNTFIANLPNALIGAVMAPKYLLPISLIYKATVGAVDGVKELMKKLSKLFNQIITDLYWIFIEQFWRLVKVELLALLSKTAAKILKNKFSDYTMIITILISLLTEILNGAIDNCDGLYSVISNTIDKALSIGSGTPAIPGLLLSIADLKGGYSTDLAHMDAMQRMEAIGINTGLINGESNKLHDIVKGVLDGQWFTQKKSGYNEASNQLVILPPPVPGIPMVLPPGLIRSVGIQR
jgi:diacylglycerol kinase